MAGLYDVIIGAANLDVAIRSEQDRLNRIEADQQIKAFSLDFNNALNAKMNELSSRADYQNFDKYIDDFYNEQRNKITPENYSPYSARQLEDYLNQNYQSSMFQVKATQLQAQKNRIVDEAGRYTDAIFNSTTELPYAYEQINDSLINCVAAGAMSGENYVKAAITNYNNLATDRALKAGQAIIAAGGTIEEATEAAKKVIYDDNNFKLYDPASLAVVQGTDNYGDSVFQLDKNGSATLDTEGIIDKDGLFSKVDNALKTQWNTQIAALQKQNNGKMEEYYANIFAGGDDNYMQNIADAKKFLGTMNSNTLPEGKLKYWTDVIYGMEEAVANNATTAKGNSTAKVMSAKTILDTNEDLFINQLALNNGKYENIAAAQEAWVDKSYNDYLAASGLSENEYSLYDFFLQNGQDIRNFLLKAQDAKLIPDNAIECYKKAESYLISTLGNVLGKDDKAVRKHLADMGIDPEEEVSAVKDIIWDLMMEVDPNDKEASKTFNTKFNERIGARYISHITDYDITRRNGESNDTAIARVAYKLGLDNSAYTTDDNNVLWGGQRKKYYANGVEENMSTYQEAFSAEIEKVAGKKLKLTPFDEETLYDANALPIFRDENTGDQYKIVSDDGKTYSIMKKQNGSNSWEEIKTVDSNALDPEKAVGGNALQYQIQEAEAKQQDKEAPVNAQKQEFSERYEANTATSKVLKEIDRRGITPHFYEGFWKNTWIGKVKTEEEFKEWWESAPEQKRQQYLEWLRDNYSGRYTSMVNGLNK